MAAIVADMFTQAASCITGKSIITSEISLGVNHYGKASTALTGEMLQCIEGQTATDD